MRRLSEADSIRLSLHAKRFVTEVLAILEHPAVAYDDPELERKFADQDRMTSTYAGGFLLEALASVMSREFALGGLAAAVAQRTTIYPEALGEVLTAINVDARELFACSRQDVARFRTLQDIADALAGLETDGELQDKPDGEGMSGDDAAAALSNLITWGRQVSNEPSPVDGAAPVAPFHAAWMKTVEHRKALEDLDQAFPFKAEVPGHVAPEGGEL